MAVHDRHFRFEMAHYHALTVSEGTGYDYLTLAHESIANTLLKLSTVSNMSPSRTPSTIPELSRLLFYGWIKPRLQKS